MKEYDVIVIGSGAGLNITYKALSEDMKVALVAREYLGGTACYRGKTSSAFRRLRFCTSDTLQLAAGRFIAWAFPLLCIKSGKIVILRQAPSKIPQHNFVKSSWW
jgi:hypothetical protein